MLADDELIGSAARDRLAAGEEHPAVGEARGRVVDAVDDGRRDRHDRALVELGSKSSAGSGVDRRGRIESAGDQDLAGRQQRGACGRGAGSVSDGLVSERERVATGS